MAAIRMLALVLACTAVSIACAPVPPTLSTDGAETLLRDAREAGGRDDPNASYYLELAERELSRARMLAAHDPEGAASWARRADADADVARMLAVEAAVRRSAQWTIAQANVLFQQIEAGR